MIGTLSNSFINVGIILAALFGQFFPLEPIDMKQ